VSIDKAGTVSIVVSEAYKKANGADANPYDQLDAQNQVAFDEYTKVIGDPATTTITVVDNSDEVNTGDYDLSSIDISDMEKYDNVTNGTKSPVVFSAAGKLLHETEEQYQKQAKLGNATDDYSKMNAHNSGISVENSYNGSVRASMVYDIPKNIYYTPNSTEKDKNKLKIGDQDWEQNTVTTSDGKTVYVTVYYEVTDITYKTYGNNTTYTIHEKLTMVTQNSSKKIEPADKTNSSGNTNNK
ncbi:MAG TPA: hypothetical protein VFJ43_18095, partial [Bacteroidia bacterium]|nr:hypothetical protein [Bacteroidia bacterium]